MSEARTAQLYDKKESTAFYDERYAHGYLDDWPAAKKQKIQEVLLSLDLPQTGTALDFGCGTGVLTELIGQTLPGWAVCGTDLSTVAITTARQRYGKLHFFTPGDAGIAGKRFDLIVSHHVLEHVYNIAEVLAEIDRYLKPDAGMLHILPCGNEDGFCHRLCKLRNEGINAQLGNRFFFEDEGHVRRLTTDELAMLCAKQGFALKRDYYTGQHYGAIDYITKSEPHLIPLLADWASGIDAAAKRKIFLVGLYLRAVAACRSYAARVEKKRGQTSKSAGDWLRLSLALPPYLIARSVERRMTFKALEEWNTRRAARNGDQMFLYFTRTVSGNTVNLKKNSDCAAHGSAPWQTVAHPDDQQTTLSTRPAVTVLMGVYNAEPFLRKAVESILGQTFGDFEFIIINDGSTDRSGEILASFAAKDSRIRIIEAPNQGLTKCLNLGLTYCRGQYIARMDADDISRPERFAKQIDFLDRSNETVALGTGVELIDEDDESLGIWERPTTHEELERAHLSGLSGRIAHPSVMLRASTVKQLGGYREDLSTGQDYDLFLRLGEIGRIENLPEILLRYRMHLSGISFTRSEEQYETVCKILREAFLRRGLNLAEMPSPPSFIRPTVEDSLVMFAKVAMRNGNLPVAKKHAVRALRRLPIKHPAWPQMVRVAYGKWAGRVAQRLPRQMILRFSRA